MRPAVSQYYNLFILGQGNLGKVEDFKEPNVKSMKGESALGYKIDIAIPEAMEAEATLSSVNDTVYTAMQKMDDAKFEIKETVIEDGKQKSIIHTIVGPFEFEYDSTKTKETKKAKIKFSPRQYTKEIDGKEVLFVDVFAPIVRENGKDVLEEMRNKII